MADVTAQVVGAVRKSGQYLQAQFAANEQNEQIVAAGLPSYTEMTRKGNGWSVMSVVAVAGLVVRPSTVAAFEIWNGYATGGKSLIVDRLFYFNLVSTNVIEGFSGWAQVAAAKAAPSAGANVITRGHSGKAYPGPVIAGLGTTVIDSGWFPWGQAISKGAGGVVPFGAIDTRVEGRLIVPPQCALCLHVVSSLVGQTFTQGASWYEEQLTIE
jgi:hypothetical protein